jgi:hypothetical protein
VEAVEAIAHLRSLWQSLDHRLDNILLMWAVILTLALGSVLFLTWAMETHWWSGGNKPAKPAPPER